MDIIEFILVGMVLIGFAASVLAVFIGFCKLACEDAEQKHKEASAKEFNEEWGDK